MKETHPGMGLHWSDGEGRRTDVRQLMRRPRKKSRNPVTDSCFLQVCLSRVEYPFI